MPITQGCLRVCIYRERKREEKREYSVKDDGCYIINDQEMVNVNIIVIISFNSFNKVIYYESIVLSGLTLNL